jgi:hypothetical protein
MTLAEQIEALRAAGADEIAVLPSGEVRGRFQRTVAVDPQQKPPQAIPVSPGPGVADFEELMKLVRENQPPFEYGSASNEEPCLHRSCPACKAGICSGLHWISCPCERCTPRVSWNATTWLAGEALHG